MAEDDIEPVSRREQLDDAQAAIDDAQLVSFHHKNTRQECVV